MSLPPTAPEPSSSVDQNRWFTDEVQTHDASLRNYLHGTFPTIRDVDDIVQESYLRIWKARAIHPIRSVKSFLFQIARNMVIDSARRHQTSPIDHVGDLARLPVIEDRLDVIEAVSTQEKARLLMDALASLPPRCREIVMLRKLKCLSQKEVAARLGIAEKTVDEHLARGVRRLENYFQRRGITGLYRR